MAVVVATWDFALQGVKKCGDILLAKEDSLGALEEGIKMVELDESVNSVGYGGFPNSEGKMELDAVIMEGNTLRCGAVGGLQGFKSAISVARKVLEHSPHTFIVGEGAQKFALSQGFQLEDNLSQNSLKSFQEYLKSEDSKEKPHDTIGMLILDGKSNLVGGCATSGYKFKHPGRVGDSPIIGSGLFVDNEVGAATATGDGDEMMKHCLSFLIVEKMRDGKNPQEACEIAIRRMIHKKKLVGGSNFEAAVLAVDKQGRYGAAVIGFKEFPFAVWSQSTGTAHIETVYPLKE